VVPESGAQNIVNVVGRVKLVNPPEADLVRGEDGLFRLGSGGTARHDERGSASGPSKAATSTPPSRW
jgi:flagellar basal-body rod protein FlgF